VEFLIEMSGFKWSLSIAEGIALVNSIISGTKYKQCVKDFQEKFCVGTMKAETTKGMVGEAYWANFMKRHSQDLCAKCGEKFAGNCTNWSTYQNFKQMYDKCYSQMVKSGLVIALPEPVYMDKLGKLLTKTIHLPLVYL